MTSSRLRNGYCQIALRSAPTGLSPRAHSLRAPARACSACCLCETAAAGGSSGTSRSRDPAPHHVVAPRHAVDVARRRIGEQAEDLVAHRLGAALVGIEAENPFVAASLDGAIAQIAKAVERHLDHPRAEARGDLGGAVGAAGIDDDDLVGPQHAFDRGFDLLGLVECEDIGGDFLHGRVCALSLRLLARGKDREPEIHGKQRRFDQDDEDAAAIDLRKEHFDHGHGDNGSQPHHRAPCRGKPQADRGHEVDHGKEHRRRLPSHGVRLKTTVGRRADAAYLRPVIEPLDQRHPRHDAQEKDEIFRPGA